MPYDKSLDKEIFLETKDFGETRIIVGVYSYNGGEKKLQMTRQNKDRNEEWQFVKLGRVSKSEAQEMVPAIMKAVEHM